MSPARPALLGGDRVFPDGLQLVKPYVPDIPGLTQRIARILESGLLTNGATVRELEETLAERLQVRHVVAVSSCTAGLMLSMQGAGVSGPVVMPSFTFSASAHAVAWGGNTPLFADVSADSLTLDPDAVRELAAGAGAISATHIYGTPCQVEALQQIADEAEIPLFYDAAHALGSLRKSKPIGGFGTAEVFSMSPTKVTTAVEGGIVATDDDSIAEHVRIGRNYGNAGDYDCAFPGLNARMSELHAAVALAALQGLDERLEHRRHLVDTFWAGIADLPGLRRPTVDAEDVSTYKDLTLVVDPDELGLDVPELTAALAAEGIDSRRYFYPPIHRQKAYAGTTGHGALPVTDELSSRVISPPLWTAMTENDVRTLAALFVSLHESATQVRDALQMTATAAPTSRVYDALGYRFDVVTDDPDIADRLALACGDLAAHDGAAGAGMTYRIEADDPRGTVRLLAGDEIVVAGTQPWHAISMLLWHVNQATTKAAARSHVVLHAAAAVLDGRAVVLPAPMESGKTTTVSGLVLDGFDYLTDEAAAIDPADLFVERFPKALSVDDGSWVVLAQLGPLDATAMPRQWSVPVSSIPAPSGRVGQRARPYAVVFPQYEVGAPTRLEPCSPGQALLLMAQSTFHFLDDPARNLAVLGDVVRTVSGCYQLTVGDLPTAVALVRDVMATP